MKQEFSAGEVDSLLGIIKASLLCTGEEDFRGLIAMVARLFPFDFAVCWFAKVNKERVMKSYEMLNINCPAGWLEGYFRKALHRIDPVVIRNFTHFGVQYWDDTYSQHNTPKELLDHAEVYGLTKGYSCGMRAGVGSAEDDGGSLFSFSGRSVKRDPRTETVLRHITPHLHMAFVQVLGGEKSLHSSLLSYREMEILKWLKLGKTSWDISVILDISVSTVNYHVNNITRKLGVSNRMQAVSEAIRQGFLKVE